MVTFGTLFPLIVQFLMIIATLQLGFLGYFHVDLLKLVFGKSVDQVQLTIGAAGVQVVGSRILINLIPPRAG